MFQTGFLKYIFEMPRIYKRAVTLISDSVFVLASVFIALFVRTGYEMTEWVNEKTIAVSLVLIFVSVNIWIRLGLYRAIIRYMDLKVLSHLFWGVLLSTLSFVILLFVSGAELPRSVPFIYATVILFFISGSRLLVRGLINTHSTKEKIPVLIYGAGSSGRQLCTSLLSGEEYLPVAFVDDNPSLHGTAFCDVHIHHPDKLKAIVESTNAQKVLFAIPSISKDEKRKIFSKVQKLKLEMLTIPGNADLISGKVSVNNLRSVNIEDLLGREPVKPSTSLLQKCIVDKVVLVTGAGGSIGSELSRQILKLEPTKLILLDSSEFNLYSVDSELRNLDTNIKVIPLLGDVQNKEFLENVFRTFKPNTVYHAAAYKHVPLVEYNIERGILNNVWGTKNCAELAQTYGASHFILVSTDKAVRPTNVMGTTKRIAELIVQDLAKKSNHTVFSMVRFGNVLGSSGSVIPLFCKQIENGGPVTVTHPKITRFFMTIPEAATLVIQAGAMAKGGDVFVLDMGEPVKIADMARKMIQIMGFKVKSEDNPDGDIEIVYSGLRPGEKLYEELLIGDNVNGTDHPRIMRSNEISMNNQDLNSMLDSISTSLKEGNLQQVREIMISAPTGFNPSSPLTDVLWVESEYKTKTNAKLSVISKGV